MGAQIEKVMKSQAFADNSKYEFMKSKRMFELNPRHPMIIKLNEQVVAGADDNTKNQIMSLYLAAVIAAGYQLTPEDAAELSPEIEVPDDVEEEAEEEAAEAEE